MIYAFAIGILVGLMLAVGGILALWTQNDKNDKSK